MEQKVVEEPMLQGRAKFVTFFYLVLKRDAKGSIQLGNIHVKMGCNRNFLVFMFIKKFGVIDTNNEGMLTTI